MHKLITLALTLLCLATTQARAQAVPMGNGLLGQYYDGENFERLMLVRRDATVDFEWLLGEPAPGLPTEHFSVRWIGWLVVPTSGIYRFHARVDDGMRVWLNDRVLLNEWRDQPLQEYHVNIPLTAGVAYRLRVDYYQDIVDTRAQLTWQLPGSAAAPAPIATRYLFTQKPLLPSGTPSTPPPAKPATMAKPLPDPPAKPLPAPAVTRSAVVRPAPRVVPARPMLPRSQPPTPKVSPAAVPSAGAQVTRLAEGKDITLPELYFEQGKARLLPATRAGLDSLARELAARPALRLEVQGHTDNVGNAELNRQLSQQRAEAVCLYLIAHGVADGQLRPKGYGGSQPVADNADPAQRPLNRRVVLRRL